MPPPILSAAAEPPEESDPDVVDKTKTKEIMGFQDDDRTIRKFFELVVFPLVVCLALILLFRRGLQR